MAAPVGCLAAQATPVADPTVPVGWGVLRTDDQHWSVAAGGDDAWAVSSLGDVMCEHAHDGWVLLQARGEVATSRIAVGAGGLYAGVTSDEWVTTVYRWNAGWEVVHELPGVLVGDLSPRADGTVVVVGARVEELSEGVAAEVGTWIEAGSGDTWATVATLGDDADIYGVIGEGADGELVLGGSYGAVQWGVDDAAVVEHPAGQQIFRALAPGPDGGILATTEAWSPPLEEGEPRGYVVRGDRGALTAEDLGRSFDEAAVTADGVAWVGGSGGGEAPAILLDEGAGWRGVDGVGDGWVSGLAARADGTLLGAFTDTDGPARLLAGSSAGLASEWVGPEATEPIYAGWVAPDGTAWFAGWGLVRWGRDGEATPTAPDRFVGRIAGTGPADVVVAFDDGFGGTELVTWDGAAFSEPWPAHGIVSLSGASDGSVYAVESRDAPYDSTSLLERTSTGWARVYESDGVGFVPERVYTLGADDVLGLAAADGEILLARWDGATWTPTGAAVVADGSPTALWATAVDDVWFAAGRASDDGIGTLFHWDGAAVDEIVDAPPNPQSLAGNADGVYVTGCEGGDTLYAWDGATWAERAEFPGGVVVAASDGGLVVQDERSTAWRLAN